MYITFLISILFIYPIHGFKSCCEISKECELLAVTKRHLPTNQKRLICRLNDDSRLQFNQSLITSNEKVKSCQIKELIIRPKKENSLKLKSGLIDYKSLIEYTKSFNKNQEVIFELFNGFQVNLFDEIKSDIILNDTAISFLYCTLDFYSGDKLLKSCQDFQEATNSTNIRSIFQLLSKNYLKIELSETKNKICPLVFKDLEIYKLEIIGENTFYSKRLLTISPEKFQDLNVIITKIEIDIDNADLDFDFLHPSVFKNLKSIIIHSKMRKIDENLFHILKNVTHILIKLDYMRSLMHKNGIEWIRNINKDVNCDLNNSSQIREYSHQKRLKFIQHELEIKSKSLPLRVVFPDEDFCLYKDFPINQLVVMIVTPNNKTESEKPKIDIGCTYLWLTRSYKKLAKVYKNKELRFLLDSEEYKSISKCNFDERLKLCNSSNFKRRHITTVFEISQIMFIFEVILNISSYILSILGLVSNLLIIITISSKLNKTDFKEFKQYDYLRLNSICNCLILIIHITTWLNDCIYPFQVFCPIIRKTIFMQYFKIVVQDVLMTALRFMNSFTYIGFAFNRISLIGKDHNKLVKLMCEISIKKFTGLTIVISIGLSVIKFFEYDINPGIAIYSYPISYNYISSLNENKPNIVFFILNFISDILNHLVLLLVNLVIDIGMILKLKQTLNERFEKFKEYSTIDQQNKKKTENQTVLDNAISMVILNTSLNLLLKLPTSSYSLIYLFYNIYRQYKVPYVSENRHLERFFKRFCIEGNFCEMILKLSDFLYLLSISLQFVFYKHYDKKLNSAIKKKFGPKKNIQAGLYTLFNVVNIITSPNIANETLENKNSKK